MDVFELMAKYDEQSRQANDMDNAEISAKSDCCCDCCECCGSGCICMSLFADGSCC